LETFKLKISPNRELFYSKDTDYGVYSCNLKENLTPDMRVHLHPTYETLTLTGNMPKLELYRTYTINCTEEDSKYGKQYKFQSVEIKKANTSDEQFDFLITMLTPLQISEIKKIYDMPVDEIIKDTFDYRKVKGIGRKLYPKIKKKVFDNYVYFQLLSELGKYGITYRQITKLYDKYLDANTAVNAVRNNPYILMELPGVGFKKADQIALNMGIKSDDEKRVVACIQFILSKDNDRGHTWSNIHDVDKEVNNYIGVELNILDYINNNSTFTIIDDIKLTTTLIYKTEVKVAEELVRISNNDTKYNIDINKFINSQEKEQGFEYDERQKEIFEKVIDSSIFVLTGSAGTGKSFSVNGLLNMFDQNDISYCLMSPSAKAAKVLEKYTNRKTTTIHRGLMWTPQGFMYNRENLLPYDVIVIDEIGMVGVYLFYNVLEAIGDDTKIILVGDPSQIPSIEIGSILDDILQSKVFANVQLNKVFRQAESSGIINVATKTRNGISFVKSKLEKGIYYGNNKDTVIIPTTKENTFKYIIKTYKYLLNKEHTDDDIMVLLPTRINVSGTLEMNKVLQEINNPYSDSKKEFKYGFKNEIIFRENDKVIHTKNDYKAIWYMLDEDGDFIETTNTGIFNGDVGRIYKIIEDEDSGETFIYVRYNNKFIVYENGNLKNLEHSWSLTVHRSQGSSYPIVILGLDARNYYMAKRNLLYTGITRASEQLYLCCEPYIINKAINDNEILEKRTFLKDILNKNNI